MRASFPITVHLLFIRKGRVLLSRRFQTGYRDGDYSVPAGHLDGGETVTRAAIREAREEVGLVLSPANLAFACVIHRSEDDERVDFFLRMNHWQGQPINTEPHKCDDLRWFKLAQLPENMVPYVRRGIHNALSGVPFDEYGWEQG